MIEGKFLKPFMLMPAKPGTCPQCAVKHEPEAPHNKDSLFYQYYFYNENGRWPTWEDAMAHCSEDVKESVREVLRQHDVKAEEI